MHRVHLEKYIPENFYPWMDFFFKIIGLQPPKGTKKKIVYIILTIVNIFTSLFVTIFLEWTELFRNFKKDFKHSMLTLSLCTLHSVMIFRLVFWFFTRSKLTKVKEVVQRDSFDFKCFSIYKIQYKKRIGGTKFLKYDDLKVVWAEAKLFFNHDKNEVEKFRKVRMVQTRALCCCLYLSFYFLTLFTIYTSYINVLGVGKYKEFNIKYNATSTYRIYPYHMYFPFDTSVSHGYYWGGYFYQIYAYSIFMMIFLPIDTIITNSIIHVISQTVIVGEALKRVGENIDYSEDEEMILLLQEIRIVKCINELQDIYRAVFLIEDLCNLQLLIQYGASVFILCSLCYIIPLVNNVGEFICSFIFLCATLGEIFIFTYCSQTLSLEIQNVILAVYNLNWVDYPPKLRRNLVFLISRLQKPCNLTAGKTFTLDLFFFIQVTQKAYSFYTLISNTRK